MAVSLEYSYEFKVVFQIPEWFPQDRFDYNTGEPNYDYKNRAEDQLWKHFGKDIDETCFHPANKWISMEFTGPRHQLDAWASKQKKRLENFFNRYKEAR